MVSVGSWFYLKLNIHRLYKAAVEIGFESSAIVNDDKYSKSQRRSDGIRDIPITGSKNGANHRNAGKKWQSNMKRNIKSHPPRHYMSRLPGSGANTLASICLMI